MAAKGERPGGQVLSALQDVGREEVARILSELVLGERCGQMVHELGFDEEQEDAAGDLEQPVETLSRMATSKTLSKPVLGLNLSAGLMIQTLRHGPDLSPTDAAGD
jgi:hypothetical protein